MMAFVGAPIELKTEAKILHMRKPKTENESITIITDADPVKTTKGDAERNLLSKRQKIL